MFRDKFLEILKFSFAPKQCYEKKTLTNFKYQQRSNKYQRTQLLCLSVLKNVAFTYKYAAIVMFNV